MVALENISEWKVETNDHEMIRGLDNQSSTGSRTDGHQKKVRNTSSNTAFDVSTTRGRLLKK